jgi:hypothetical protein
MEITQARRKFVAITLHTGTAIAGGVVMTTQGSRPSPRGIGGGVFPGTGGGPEGIVGTTGRDFRATRHDEQ